MTEAELNFGRKFFGILFQKTAELELRDGHQGNYLFLMLLSSLFQPVSPS